MKKHNDKRKSAIIYLGFIFAVALYFLGANTNTQITISEEMRPFIINVTASLPRGIYLKIPRYTLKEGDFVVYEPEDDILAVATSRGWLDDGHTTLLKKIGAMPGDTYRLTDDRSFYIGGRYIGKAYEEDREGRPMPSIGYGEDKVPEGCFLPVGKSTRSFDGRYSGPVPMGQIKFKCVPFITEDTLKAICLDF